MSNNDRPAFIVASTDVPEATFRYPQDAEPMAPTRPIGSAAGLRTLGLHVQRVAPGQRTSWPHAEETEEEFVYVLEGEVDAWIDGTLYPMKAGELAAFPAGTGICHTFLNNGPREATLLVGGEASKADNRTFYPFHPQRRSELGEYWWEGAPSHPRGPHDGKPSVTSPSALRRESP